MKKQKQHHDQWKRSLVKTVTYRIAIVIVVFFIAILVTHKVSDALAITGWNAVLATFIYYAHERIWSRIKWGRS